MIGCLQPARLNRSQHIKFLFYVTFFLLLLVIATALALNRSAHRRS
jgi:hypothetical protein